MVYATADGDKVVAEEDCGTEELDADPVGVEEGAEELEPVLTKLATGGPGNVYSMGGLSICLAISNLFDPNQTRKSNSRLESGYQDRYQSSSQGMCIPRLMWDSESDHLRRSAGYRQGKIQRPLLSSQAAAL
jgi:hypothetical protein